MSHYILAAIESGIFLDITKGPYRMTAFLALLAPKEFQKFFGYFLSKLNA
jgi:hypothetical protein